MARSRARASGSLSRNKRPKRQAKTRILIVCEGKTERLYFEAIKREIGQHSNIVIEVKTTTDTDPLKIVQYAEKFVGHTQACDEAFCVFDRDDHAYFSEAIQYASKIKCTNDTGDKISFTVIPSDPNFELWLLLHFEQRHSDCPIDRNDTFSKVKEYLEGYCKGYTKTYERTRDKLEIAYRNSAILEENLAVYANPCTAVSKLVKYLRAEDTCVLPE